MKRNAIMFFAVVMVLLMAVLPAFAANSTGKGWGVGSTVTTGYVMQGANTTALYTAAAPSSPIYTVSLGESAALIPGGFVLLKLTGGAVFNSSYAAALPTLGTTATGAALGLVEGGTTGYSYAKYSVTGSGIPSSATITFNLASTGVLNVLSVTSGAGVDATLSIYNNSMISYTVDKSLYSDMGNYLLVGANLLVPVYNQGLSSIISNQVDVLATTGPFTKFINNTLVGSEVTLTVGTPVPGSSPVAYITLGSNTIPSTSTAISAKKILVTLAGDFAGISKIECGSAFTGSDSTGATTGGLIGQFIISSDKTKAYAVNNGTYSGSSTDIKPKFYIDGTTTQIARSFNIQVENLADSANNWAANTWLSSMTGYKIIRNGVSFSANSLGPLNTVKITEKTGNVPTAGAKVLISAFDADGNRLAEVAGAPELLLQKFATMQLTGDVIAARFTGTPMAYEFAVASTGAIVTNVKKTAEGFGSTVYTDRKSVV